MRIVIDISGYHLRNMGDVSMLQIAAQRLRSRLPDCDLAILTTDPERLAKFVGGRPLDPLSRVRWNKAPILPRRPAWFPANFDNYLTRNELSFREFRPRLANRLAAATELVTLNHRNRAVEFAREIERADLVVATGGGFLTDAFETEAIETLQTLTLGLRFGKPTVLLGQGIGPVANPSLMSQMAAVLPRLDLITLRERRAAEPILRELGVPSDRVVCTGDDAVELAHALRPNQLGNDLGVNVRLSYYSGVSDEDRRAFSTAIGAFLADSDRQARPIPISFHESENDEQSARQLIDVSRLATDHPVTDTPESIIRAVGRCRLVVTGSYHAAVFALSQGVSVVGWARSPYYEDKFLGLADMFGAGCHVVREHGPAIHDALLAALRNCDAQADAAREPLLQAARRQIERANNAYGQVCHLISRSGFPA